MDSYLHSNHSVLNIEPPQRERRQTLHVRHCCCAGDIKAAIFPVIPRHVLLRPNEQSPRRNITNSAFCPPEGYTINAEHVGSPFSFLQRTVVIANELCFESINYHGGCGGGTPKATWGSEQMVFHLVQMCKCDPKECIKKYAFKLFADSPCILCLNYVNYVEVEKLLQ